MLDTSTLFYNYSRYLRDKYGVPAYRVSVDIGLSCPNRPEGRESGGCTYCSAFGSRSTYINTIVDIEEQVRKGTDFLKKRYEAEIFLLYFQAYTNTYGDVETLKKLYDYTLGLENFSELILSTRPDCINEEIADLLASYKKDNFDVWVELGLQTANDMTLERINRGHDTECYSRAFELLRSKGIKIATHLIFGLPGEDWDSIRKSVEFVNKLKPEGIKIHNLHIPTGTELYKEYEMGEMSFPSSQRHLEYVVDALEMIDKDTVIMRLTCDTPKQRHMVPGRFWNKSWLFDLVRREMAKRGTFQGIYSS